jgi:hypothetical protein
MSFNTKKIKVVLSAILLVVAIGAFIFWRADPLFLRAPKDHELLKIFQDHRVAFERLRNMAIEDSPKDWYFSESHLDDQINEKRKQEYIVLFSEIHPGLVVTASNGSVRFIFESGGLSAISPGWLKGIEYLSGGTEREGLVVQDLDQPTSLPAGSVYLRQIEPSWFLVFQNTD